ncbi:MAG: hypothetical protein ACN6O3_01500 [Comamonas sp.]
MPAPASPLGPAQIALIARGVSTIVASRDACHRPSLMRAVGSAINPAGDEITAYLGRTAAAQLLADLAATGRVAVVFSQPSTNLALQVKAGRVRLRPAEAGDTPVLQRYLQSMEHELGQLGFGPQQVRTFLAYRLDDLAAVQFTPEQAFDQTPGRAAGSALCGTQP